LILLHWPETLLS